MTQNPYEGVLQFKGKWRDYQQRVLTNAQHHLNDGKVHIVAAPGSGKTTLGIELIRRLGKSCLILSPSITIRQQWLHRIEEGFLVAGNKPEDLLSNDLQQLRAITAITYQALYSAMQHDEGELADEEDDAPQAESVDFRDFDIIQQVKAAGVQTVCLDEAHHLRSQWWNALEAFLKSFPEMTVIALTATPPYDSTPAQWKRYIDLCGPIDEEIFTPELVCEGSLCPHEDYVYFNWPTKAELDKIQTQQQAVQELYDALLADRTFTDSIASHKGLHCGEACSEFFLDHPEYFSSLLIFCQAQNVAFSPYLKELIGTKGRLPDLDMHWLETLLQGFLYDDADSYCAAPAQRQQLLQSLKEAGCIHRNRVVLTQQEALQKLLMKSQGKMESIGTIVQAEYNALGENLRLLVLCDYIKKDALPLVGSERPLLSELGAVPIFESLRRKAVAGVRLGCLSGTVVLLPLDTQQALQAQLAPHGESAALSPIKDTGYGLLHSSGGRSTHLVAAVTALFSQGKINTLIGTKSLLGEGWDAPCINTLILATYVGSFMLSNQMRGRTIRIDRTHPQKIGNIWHLACVFPQKAEKNADTGLCGDYETLVRRFDAFLGVSWKENCIESGIDRLGIASFHTRRQMDQINQTMLARAADRDALHARWQDALGVIHGGMQIEQVESVPASDVPTGYVFIHALCMEILSIIVGVLLTTGRVVLHNAQAPVLFALGAGLCAAAFFAAKYAVKLFRFSTPARRMKRIAQAVTDALLEIGALEDGAHCRAAVQDTDGTYIGTWLRGGTMRDKTTFSGCMQEIWGVIDNPRYLLTRKTRCVKSSEYYCVPEVFANHKERAAVFEKHMRRVLGNYHLVYTRTPQGRKTLLRARTRSFVNKNQSVLLGKKVAKGKYE